MNIYTWTFQFGCQMVPKGYAGIFGYRYLDERSNIWHGIGIVIKCKCSFIPYILYLNRRKNTPGPPKGCEMVRKGYQFTIP